MITFFDFSQSNGMSLTSDGVFDIYPPTSSLFSMQSATTASGAALTVQDSANVLSATYTSGSSSGDFAAFVGKAVPAGSSWSAVLGMWMPFSPRGAVDAFRPGLAILENSTGKNLQIGFDSALGDPQLHVLYSSSFATYTTNVASVKVFALRSPIHFRVSYDGTNYTFDYSLDFMDTWLTLATVTAASYFTADRVGIRMQCYFSAANQKYQVQAFYYSDPDYIPA